ncbi:hypothetical protein [Microbacterium telephonicum]|uniref:Uncharacterized protein n=1 Tax=Microbacterium telephonicum TaxID=1714841 RepID=A0A498C559_9MICO|nr:hypothetical protein [Microbacterium telephonicum]RLK47611.1 hypothetical protein C7474_2203 [Microbacterium telephonicum]
MGHTLAPTGEPTYTPTPTQTVADLQAAVTFAKKIGGLLKGTAVERQALTTDESVDGWFFSETDTGRLYQRVSGSWVRLNAVARGTFNAATSGTGTATVTHGLGVTPSQVVATDRSGGTAVATRKIVVNAVNDTQIQFVVYNGGSAFASNPVQFDWVAYA